MAGVRVQSMNTVGALIACGKGQGPVCDEVPGCDQDPGSARDQDQGSEHDQDQGAACDQRQGLVFVQGQGSAYNQGQGLVANQNQGSACTQSKDSAVTRIRAHYDFLVSRGSRISISLRLETRAPTHLLATGLSAPEVCEALSIPNPRQLLLPRTRWSCEVS